MGKSFFLGTDAELYHSSQNFATRILADAPSYGLSFEQAELYGTLNDAWRSAYKTAIAPATRTKATVASKREARRAVMRMASDLTTIIKGRNVSDAQKIALGISVRAARAPLPAPGTPVNFSFQVFADGSLELRWKCANPRGSRGTLYQGWRRIGAGELTYLGGSGEKKLRDMTIPAGSSSVTYHIQAVRSTAVGEWGQFNVNFGVNVAANMNPESMVRTAA